MPKGEMKFVCLRARIKDIMVRACVHVSDNYCVILPTVPSTHTSKHLTQMNEQRKCLYAVILSNESGTTRLFTYFTVVHVARPYSVR